MESAVCPFGHHRRAFQGEGAAGDESRKVQPLPISLSTVSVPLICSARSQLIAADREAKPGSLMRTPQDAIQLHETVRRCRSDAIPFSQLNWYLTPLPRAEW